MDSMAGTHLVPPAFALPPNQQPVPYAPEIRGWLEEYEEKFGPRATSTMTTEQVPLAWTCGEARVIDVTQLIGTTNKNDWPASPQITVHHIQTFEKTHGETRGGAVVENR